MKLVIDTNAFYHSGTWLLLETQVEILKKGIQQLHLKILIPEIVLNELKQNFQESLEDNIKTVKDKLTKLNAMTAQPEPKHKLHINHQEECKNYETRLTQQLNTLTVEILPFNDIEQKAVVKRLFSKRKPFKETRSGKKKEYKEIGYKDTLIWESILNHAVNQNDRIYWVSRNKKDFADQNDETQLHPHLIQDLKKNDLPENSVQLITSLEEFNKQIIKPKLENLTKLANEIETGTCAHFNFIDFWQNNIEELNEKANSWLQYDWNEHPNPLLNPLFDYISEPEIELFDPPDKFSVTKAVETAQNSTLISLTTEIEDTLYFFLPKEEAYGWPDDSEIDIIDPDWNKWVVRASAQCTFELEIDIVLTDQEIDYFDVIDVQLRTYNIKPAKK